MKLRDVPRVVHDSFCCGLHVIGTFWEYFSDEGGPGFEFDEALKKAYEGWLPPEHKNYNSAYYGPNDEVLGKGWMIVTLRVKDQWQTIGPELMERGYHPISVVKNGPAGQDLVMLAMFSHSVTSEAARDIIEDYKLPVYPSRYDETVKVEKTPAMGLTWD